MKMTYEEALAYILQIPRFTKKNNLNHTRRLLAQLGSPERDCRVIHVAGTNGKGSVCAGIAAVLNAAGIRTGLFTSPHLIRINERFRINGAPVSDDQFLAGFHMVYKTVTEQTEKGMPHPTFFEFLFLMAMLLFRTEGMEYVVLETGMGGRLDATNVITDPVLTIITTIGLDHTQILGSTMREIAGEKAGIIKPGVPLIADGRNAEVLHVLQMRADELDVPVTALDQSMYEIQADADEGIIFSLTHGPHRYEGFRLAGSAPYQAVNGMLVLLALEKLEAGITEAHLRSGLQTFVWPGRMERIRPDIILDGAHNPAGISELNLRMRQEAEPVWLLFACTKEKDPEEMVRLLCEDACIGGVVVTETAGDRSTAAEILRQEFERYVTGPVLTVRDNYRSLQKVLQLKGNSGILFVAGSLYLIGNIREALGNEGSVKA